MKDEHRKFISGIRSQVVRVGFMGVVGNKGGIGIRFSIYNTSFCCITAHLAAHMEQVEQRNQNFQDILNGCTFDEPDKLYHPENHDVLIFFGDLNYRIAKSYEDVLADIECDDIRALTANDQLTIEKNNNRAFVGFQEPDICFLPTYRFEVGTVIYDRSEKKRVPAYTDRVLYKFNAETSDVKPVQYTSAHSISLSDHKPVLALLDVRVRVIKQEIYKELYKKFETIYQELISENDNDWIEAVHNPSTQEVKQE